MLTGRASKTFAVNHLTAPKLAWQDLLLVACDLGCAGLTFRNDLGRLLFGLGHDTIHHTLTGSDRMSADVIELIHVSGVSADVPCAVTHNSDRHLVTTEDKLDTIAQIAALPALGVTAPASFEAFSSDMQADTAPQDALPASIDVISAALDGMHAPASGTQKAPIGAPV